MLTDPQSLAFKCAQCGTDITDGLYDERAEHYYCDTRCYEEWADANYEEVVLFYAKMNVD